MKRLFLSLVWPLSRLVCAYSTRTMALTAAREIDADSVAGEKLQTNHARAGNGAWRNEGIGSGIQYRICKWSHFRRGAYFELDVV